METANTDLSQISLLIVDDERCNVLLLETLVQDMGMNVFTSFNSKEALSILDNNAIDVVVTDIMMPEIDGFELISEIKMNMHQDPYIIVVTALEDIDSKVKGMELGANDYITKPFNFPEMKSRIKIGIRETLLNKELTLSNRILKKREEELHHALEVIKNNQAIIVQQGKMASLGILSAGVAHEINNPAAFINVNANAMEKWWVRFVPIFDRAVQLGWDRELGLEKLSEMRVKFPKMIQANKDGVERISRITNALRTFARSDQEEKHWVHIKEILEQALVMTRNRYKYHADIYVESDPQVPKVYGNFQKLEQAFVNLIINASDAVKEKNDAVTVAGESFRGLISIHIQEEVPGKKISIELKDNGVGIKADILSKIFDPFFTTKPLHQGTGLGLSIVYGIVEDHNGTITTESKEGEGTIFTILLPVERDDKGDESSARAGSNDGHSNY